MIDPAIEQKIAAALAVPDLEAAATAAVRGYGPQILGYLRAVVGARGDEAFSIFCESLWRGLPGFRGEAAFITWAYQLAWGATQRIVQNPHDRRAVPLTSSTLNALAQELCTTVPPFLQTETRDRVTRIRGELDPAEQTLLVLRVDRDLPWDDVAHVMAIDVAVLRKRFERLKLKIKRLAERDHRTS